MKGMNKFVTVVSFVVEMAMFLGVGVMLFLSVQAFRSPGRIMGLFQAGTGSGELMSQGLHIEVAGSAGQPVPVALIAFGLIILCLSQLFAYGMPQEDGGDPA